MAQQTYVVPLSNEWIYATFRLHLILGSSQVQLTSLKKRISSFPQIYQNHIKIQTAVDLTDMDLSSVTSIKQSLRKDLMLKAGRVNLNLENADKRKYRILLMKTAIGQALPCLKEVGLSVQDYLNHQSQFDAVYLSPRQQELSVFMHEYMVKDPKQYQWEYDAQFCFVEPKEWHPESIQCANCHIKKASYFCPQDQQAYCQPCFGDLHRSTRKSKHLRQPISPYNCPPSCQKALHNNEPLTHYCFACKQLKCVYCLADSQHKGEQAHQSMLSRQFAVLFNDTLKQKINQAKNKIVGVIKETEGKIQLISSHYEMRVKQFARAFEERVATVRQWVSGQLNVAAGLHSELKRKYDEVLWLESLSFELQEKCSAQTGMQVKEGINVYLNQCFSRDYFGKIERKVQDLRLFS